jgi:uncharacterized protein YbbK (DUF523 family)
MNSPAPLRPTLALSGCLAGEKVRYDGGHKRNAYVVERLGDHVTWVSLCPEVEAGFGVPRPPLRLEKIGGKVKVLDVRSRGDRTEPLDTASATLAKGASAWDGAILKARSPSCGLQVSLWNEDHETDGRSPGRFAGLLVSAGVPVIDEEALEQPARRSDFLVRVFTRARWREESDPASFHERHAPIFSSADPFAVSKLATAAKRGADAYRVGLMMLLCDTRIRFQRLGEEAEFPYPGSLDDGAPR